MLIVGLTGGIATGKSTVAHMFSQLGTYRIDTDQLARQVVEPGEEAFKAIVRFFGKEVVDDVGELDRKKLSDIVFADRAKLSVLNQITHPPIRALLRAELTAAEERGVDVALVEVPLLYESGFDDGMDCVIVVVADEDTQVVRLMERNGFTEKEAKQRIAAQMPLSEKAARADYVIDNGRALASTQVQVEQLWQIFKTGVLK